MGIKVTKAKQLPALNYDSVHLCELRIVQPEEQNSKYALKITYKLIAVDGDGVKYFDRSLRSIAIEDFEQVATQKAAGGDMSLVNAHLAIQSALAAILADDSELGGAQVV